MTRFSPSRFVRRPPSCRAAGSIRSNAFHVHDQVVGIAGATRHAPPVQPGGATRGGRSAGSRRPPSDQRGTSSRVRISRRSQANSKPTYCRTSARSWSSGGPPGQQRRETIPAQRADDDAELVLHVPHRFAEHGAAADAVLADRASGATRSSPLERHPVTAELLDPHRHAELRGRATPRGRRHRAPSATAGRRRTASGKSPSASRSPRRLLDQPDQRADMADDRRIRLAGRGDDRLRPRPGPIEEQAEAMQQHVEEAGEGAGRRSRACARGRTRSGGSAGRRSGRGSRRPAAPGAAGASSVRSSAAIARRREDQRRSPGRSGTARRPGRMASPRRGLFGMRALDPAHRLEQVEATALARRCRPNTARLAHRRGPGFGARRLASSARRRSQHRPRAEARSPRSSLAAGQRRQHASARSCSSRRGARNTGAAPSRAGPRCRLRRKGRRR